MRLPFRDASAGDKYQRKTVRILKVLQNVFRIADAILVVGYSDGADHDRMV